MQLEENLPFFSLPTFLAMETWHSLPSLSPSLSSFFFISGDNANAGATAKKGGRQTDSCWLLPLLPRGHFWWVCVCVCGFGGGYYRHCYLFVLLLLRLLKLLLFLVLVLVLSGFLHRSLPHPKSGFIIIIIITIIIQRALLHFLLVLRSCSPWPAFLPPGVDCISSGGGALKWVAVSGLVCCISLMNICAWN